LPKSQKYGILPVELTLVTFDKGFRQFKGSGLQDSKASKDRTLSVQPQPLFCLTLRLRCPIFDLPLIDPAKCSLIVRNQRKLFAYRVSSNP
jgi:hypothetical protein